MSMPSASDGELWGFHPPQPYESLSPTLPVRGGGKSIRIFLWEELEKTV